MSKRLTLLVTTIALAVLAVACGTYTDLIGTWTKPDYVNKAYSKVLVFAIGTKSLVNQSVAERAVAARISKLGTVAVPASDIFPRGKYDADGDGKIDNPAFADEIAKRLSDQGFEAVLLFGVKDIKEAQRYVQGSVSYQPTSYYNGWYNYWSTTYQAVEQPGYYTTDVDAYVDANMFDIASGDLIWSAQTDILNPVGLSDAAESFAGVIAPALQKQGLIRSK